MVSFSPFPVIILKILIRICKTSRICRTSGICRTSRICKTGGICEPELLDDMDDKSLSLEQANMSSVQEDEAMQCGYISDGDEGNLPRYEDDGCDGQFLPRQPLVRVEVPRLRR